MPIVSAVIPTRDRDWLLRRAVRSVLAQTESDVEVVVVDDASTRVRTADVLASLRDTRVRLVELDEPLGAGAARNIGVEAATGPVVAFLDSDDVWLPRKVASQIRALGRGDVSAHASASLVHWPGHLQGRPWAVAGPVTVSTLLSGWFPAFTSGFAAQRTILLETPFDAALGGFEDWDVWIRVALRTSIGLGDRPDVVVEEHEGPRMSRRAHDRSEAIDVMHDRWQPMADDLGVGDLFRAALADMRAHVRVEALSAAWPKRLPERVEALRTHPKRSTVPGVPSRRGAAARLFAPPVLRRWVQQRTAASVSKDVMDEAQIALSGR